MPREVTVEHHLEVGMFVICHKFPLILSRAKSCLSSHTLLSTASRCPTTPQEVLSSAPQLPMWEGVGLLVEMKAPN